MSCLLAAKCSKGCSKGRYCSVQYNVCLFLPQTAPCCWCVERLCLRNDLSWVSFFLRGQQGSSPLLTKWNWVLLKFYWSLWNTSLWSQSLIKIPNKWGHHGYAHPPICDWNKVDEADWWTTSKQMSFSPSHTQLASVFSSEATFHRSNTHCSVWLSVPCVCL